MAKGERRKFFLIIAKKEPQKINSEVHISKVIEF